MFKENFGQICKHIKIENDISKIMHFKLNDRVHEIYYFQNNMYYIEEKNIIELYWDIQKDIWYKLEKNVRKKLIYKFYTKEFNKKFIEQYINNPDNIELDENFFNKHFKDLKQEEYSVVTKIYGINVSSNNTCIQLGNYLLCDYDYFHNTYKKTHNLQTINPDFEQRPIGAIDNCFIVNEKILAVNQDIAQSLFYEEVGKFINAIIFCTAWCCEDNEKISCFDSNIRTTNIVINNFDNQYTMCLSNKSLMNPLYYLNEEIFNKNNRNKIFQYLTNQNLSKMEKRISCCIDWIGQSMRTNNLTQRYTFLCIALETLLSNKTSGIMDQSITSRLREYSSYLATDDISKRQDIYKKLSKLYGIRSEISHSGVSEKLTLKDYFDLLDILYPIIDKILNLTEYLKTIEDLDKYILKEKRLLAE